MFYIIGIFFIWHSPVGIIVPFIFYISLSLFAFWYSKEPIPTSFIQKIDKLSNRILLILTIGLLAVTVPTLVFAGIAIGVLVLMFVIIKLNIYITFLIYKLLNYICGSNKKGVPEATPFSK